MADQRHVTGGKLRLAAAMLILLGTVAIGSLARAADRSSRPPATRSSGAQSSSAKSPEAIEKKLDQIIQTNQTIGQRLDDVMKELQVAKIRVTQKAQNP